jgi:hypothetical protein
VTVKVTQIELVRIKCDECSFKQDLTHSEDAGIAAKEHEAKHELSRLMGATLKDKVFHPNKDENSFGIAWNAAKHAASIGYAYFLWNGRVYTTLSTDLEHPVCDGKDVPGLEKW